MLFNKSIGGYIDHVIKKNEHGHEKKWLILEK